MKITLRNYQYEAVRAISNSVLSGENALCEMPTGSGKSVVIASVVKNIASRNKRVLILTHAQELVEQNSAEFVRYAPEYAEKTGIYSAGLNRKDIDYQIIFGSVQSYIDAAKLTARFDYLIIDEVHRMQPDGNGQYPTIWRMEKEKNANIKLIGFTATPFRMKQGRLTDGENALFKEITYRVDYLSLVKSGYLAPLITPVVSDVVNMEGVTVRKGEYVDKEATERFMEILPQQVSSIIRLSEGRNKILVFAQTVDHAISLKKELDKYMPCDSVFGETPDRQSILRRFSGGENRCLINVNVLTTGFNEPSIDVVVLCRATKSATLYVQMAGRGSRIYPGKENCLILDYGGNIMRHGPVDGAVQWRPKKKGVPIENESKEGGTPKPPEDLTPESGWLTEVDCKRHRVKDVIVDWANTAAGEKRIRIRFVCRENFYGYNTVFLNIMPRPEKLTIKEILTFLCGDYTGEYLHTLNAATVEKHAASISERYKSGVLKRPTAIYTIRKQDAKTGRLFINVVGFKFKNEKTPKFLTYFLEMQTKLQQKQSNYPR